MADTDTSIFDVIRLRNLDSARALFYTLVPPLLTALHVAHSAVWIGLALAVLAPALSAINSVSTFRTWFYGVLTAGQAVLLALHLVTQSQFTLWTSVVVAVIGGGVAASHVRTKTDTCV